MASPVSNVGMVSVYQPTDSYSFDCAPKDVENIKELIQTMGKPGIGILSGLHLWSLGAKVEHVPPLHFLGVIFSDPLMKECMEQIQKDSFKWNRFIKGLTPGIEKLKKERDFDSWLLVFASKLHVSASSLQEYVHRNDWEGFVGFLIFH